MKRKQDFILRLLAGRKIAFEEVDISLAENEDKKIFMRENSKPSGTQTVPLPPQVFNEDVYCGVSLKCICTLQERL